MRPKLAARRSPILLPRNSALAAGLFVLVAASCGKKHEEAAATTSATGSAASISIDAALPSLVTPRTTSAVIALSNLNDDITQGNRHLGDVTFSNKLQDSLMMRAQFVGSLADLDAADAIASKGMADRPSDPKAHLAKASVFGAFHQFALALKEIDRASALGATVDEVGRARQPVVLALGKCEQAVKLGDPADDALPLDLATHGAIEQRRGHDHESDRLFSMARDRYRDVSPFAMAWMDFERGRALQRQGDKARARQFYAEATTMLPVYAHAAIHLAAMETPTRALDILSALDPLCDDPDALAAKADALRRAGREDEAKTTTEKARGRFEELLTKHPEAFADHGAAFFMGIGKDLPRALSLAKKAADNAPSEEALDLWLTAATALESHDEICASLKRAATIECVLSPPVKARFDAAKATCP